MSHRIQQEVVIQASAQSVYAALTDAAKFSALSGGAPAEIEAAAGGAFSIFGGMISGYNIECVPGESLVQAWRVKNWPAGAYSIVHFALKPVASGTQVALDHAAFPEEQGAHLEAGWHQNYWQPLGQMLES